MLAVSPSYWGKDVNKIKINKRKIRIVFFLVCLFSMYICWQIGMTGSTQFTMFSTTHIKWRQYQEQLNDTFGGGVDSRGTHRCKILAQGLPQLALLTSVQTPRPLARPMSTLSHNLSPIHVVPPLRPILQGQLENEITTRLATWTTGLCKQATTIHHSTLVPITADFPRLTQPRLSGQSRQGSSSHSFHVTCIPTASGTGDHSKTHMHLCDNTCRQHMNSSIHTANHTREESHSNGKAHTKEHVHYHSKQHRVDRGR